MSLKTIKRRPKKVLKDSELYRYSLYMNIKEKQTLDKLSDKLGINRPAVVIRALDLLYNTEFK